jgi:hypothetical protein
LEEIEMSNNGKENEIENEKIEEITKDEAAPEKSELKQEKKAGKKQPEEFDFTELLPDRVEELLEFQALNLREWAHIYMGLVPHPKQKKIVLDIQQARMAIDAASAIVEIILPHIPEDHQRTFKVMMSDLKMNFMSKSAGS